jgi:hypothetical protein
VAVIFHLHRRVQTGDGREGDLRPVRPPGPHDDLLARPQALSDPLDIIDLEAGEAQGLPVLAGRNCNGSTPIPTRLLRWIRSKDSASTALTPSSAVPLAAQSREEPLPYSLPARMISGIPAS